MNFPNLSEIFNQGGPVMIVALMWLALSLLAAVMYFVGKLNKQPAFLLVFPVGFALLAITYFVLQGYFTFKEFEEKGPPDPTVYAANGLYVARTALLICFAGGLTFVSAVFALWSDRKHN